MSSAWLWKRPARCQVTSSVGRPKLFQATGPLTAKLSSHIVGLRARIVELARLGGSQMGPTRAGWCWFAMWCQVWWSQAGNALVHHNSSSAALQVLPHLYRLVQNVDIVCGTKGSFTNFTPHDFERHIQIEPDKVKSWTSASVKLTQTRHSHSK